MLVVIVLHLHLNENTIMLSSISLLLINVKTFPTRHLFKKSKELH